MLNILKGDTSETRITLSCDRCGALLSSAVRDSEAVLQSARLCGWSMEWLGGMWWHRCPECGPIAAA